MLSKTWYRQTFVLLLSVGCILAAGNNKVFASSVLEKKEVFKYDVTKEITITGLVVDQIGLMNDQNIPTRILRVRANHSKKKFIVELGPTWYINEHNFTVDNGDQIVVIGHPIEKKRVGKIKDKDKIVRVIPRNVKNVDKNNKSISIRDKQGKPLWPVKGE